MSYIKDLFQLLSRKKYRNEIIIAVVTAVILASWEKIAALFSYCYWLSFFKRCWIPMVFYHDAVIPFEDKVRIFGTAVAFCFSILIVLSETRELKNKSCKKVKVTWSTIAIILLIITLLSSAEFILLMGTWFRSWHGLCILGMAVVHCFLISGYSKLRINDEQKENTIQVEHDVNETNDTNKKLKENPAPDQNETAKAVKKSIKNIASTAFISLLHKLKNKSDLIKRVCHVIIFLTTVLMIVYSIYLFGGFNNRLYYESSEFGSIPITYNKEADKLEPEDTFRVILFETDEYYYTVEGLYRVLDSGFNQVWILSFDHTLVEKNSVTVGTLSVHGTIGTFSKEWAPPTDKVIFCYIIALVFHFHFSSLFIGLTIKRPDEIGNNPPNQGQHNEQ